MAPQLTPNQAYVAKQNMEKKNWLAYRADTSLDNLQDSLVNFCLYVMRDVRVLHGLATEHAKSSDETPMQKNQNMTRRECIEIICDEIGECYAESSAIGYTEPALLLHKKMWDVMWRCPPH